MLGDDMLIEPVTDVIIPEEEGGISTEKREVTKLRHIVYKVKKQQEHATTDDYGKKLFLFAVYVFAKTINFYLLI